MAENSKNASQRPNFAEIANGAEFNRWYWLKREMVQICKELGLPGTGSKFELRDRIMFALDNGGKLLPTPKEKVLSRFNWAKGELTPKTLITDNISFGQNLRKFMKAQIGEHFSFNTDFMAWAKEHPGRTLEEAVQKWLELENRKKDPAFRSQIADHNMYNQYLRDIMDDNPGLSAAQARTCWEHKKQLPTEDGFIRYEATDLNILDSTP